MSRRNTTATTKPAIHQYDHPDYHDYRNQRPVIQHHAAAPAPPRDHSPESGPFMVIPNSGGNVHRSQSYRPASSGYSDGSYESGDIRSLGGQKGYLISAGSGGHHRTGSREYQLSRGLSERRSRDEGRAGTVYHLDGPPRRGGRERSLSRPRGPLSDDYEYDEPMPPRRIASGQAPVMSGALVRSRSRSNSQGPSSSAGALVRRRSDDEESPPRPAPNNGTIRLEYGGQAIDIAYTGSNGKPLVGNITINTTARTVSIPERTEQPAPPAIAPPPQQLALPAPPPPQIPAGVTPVMLPAPPPPGGLPTQQALPAPPSRRLARSERDGDDTDYSHSPSGRDLYQSFSNMQLESAPHNQRPAILQEPPTRGRQMPPAGPPAPRTQSRPRAPSNPAPEDPLWTKISRDIVSKRAVRVRGYEFEEVPGAIIIYRVLGEDEIDDLVDLTERIRTGQVEIVRRERKPSVSSSASRRRSTSRRRPRPLSIHGYPTGPLGPGPSKERPPPGKPAIVHTNRGMPEAPAPPPPAEEEMARAPAPPVTVTQTKGGLRENPERPGTYVGYTRKPPRQGTAYRR